MVSNYAVYEFGSSVEKAMECKEETKVGFGEAEFCSDAGDGE